MSGKRIFFGWWVLLGIFISYTALVGIQIYTLPLFYPALIKEFHWSTEDVTRAATIFFLTGAIITPFVSSLFDQRHFYDDTTCYCGVFLRPILWENT